MKNKNIDLLKITCFVLIGVLALYVALYALGAQEIIDINKNEDDAGQQLGQGFTLALLLAFSLIACGYDAVVQLVFGILFCKLRKFKRQKVSLILYVVFHAIFVPALLYIAVCLWTTFTLQFWFLATTIVLVALSVFNLALAIVALAKHKVTAETV